MSWCDRILCFTSYNPVPFGLFPRSFTENPPVSLWFQNFSLNLHNSQIALTMAKYINRIKVVLAEQHKTNLWLARELGKDPATVSKWCTNTAQPSLETLHDIAECLHIDVRSLLNPNDSAIASEPELNYGEK